MTRKKHKMVFSNAKVDFLDSLRIRNEEERRLHAHASIERMDYRSSSWHPERVNVIHLAVCTEMGIRMYRIDISDYN